VLLEEPFEATHLRCPTPGLAAKHRGHRASLPIPSAGRPRKVAEPQQTSLGDGIGQSPGASSTTSPTTLRASPAKPRGFAPGVFPGSGTGVSRPRRRRTKWRTQPEGPQFSVLLHNQAETHKNVNRAFHMARRKKNHIYIHNLQPRLACRSGFGSQGAAIPLPPCWEVGEEPGREQGGRGTFGNIGFWVRRSWCSPLLSTILSAVMGAGQKFQPNLSSSFPGKEELTQGFVNQPSTLFSDFFSPPQFRKLNKWPVAMFSKRSACNVKNQLLRNNPSALENV